MRHKVRALLLAAGMGTRLRPLTDRWPKCLMPIGERALLEYWLETLWQHNVREVLVNVHYMPEILLKFLQRPRFREWVSFVHEPQLLGTAGTLRENANFFQKDQILLIHADNWCQCEIGDFINFHYQHRPQKTSMTMMTFKTEDPQSCGIVECDEEGVVLQIHEKVAHPYGDTANAAVYMLENEVLNCLIKNPEISDFSNELLPRFLGNICTWHNDAIHRDIGTLTMLQKAQSDLRPEPIWFEVDEWQKQYLSNPIHNKIVQTEDN
jgi:mannose-1-phosphate guanylyltransferase